MIKEKITIDINHATGEILIDYSQANTNTNLFIKYACCIIKDLTNEISKSINNQSKNNESRNK